MRYRRLGWGLGSLVVLYSLLGSTVWAVFTPQAKLSGFSFQVASMDIQVASQQGEGFGQYGRDVAFGSRVEIGPGYASAPYRFSLLNSSSGQNTLNVTAQLSPGTGMWDRLKDLVEMKITYPTEAATSDWQTLAHWSSEARLLPGSALPYGNRAYELEFRLLENYPSDPDGTGPLVAGSPVGRELMDAPISGMQITLAGTRSW